jgi:hypothetical protein
VLQPILVENTLREPYQTDISKWHLIIKSPKELEPFLYQEVEAMKV